MFGPSGPINRKYTFCRRFLLFKGATSILGKVCDEPDRWEGVGGGKTLPLVGLFEVLEGLKLSQASTRLEARGLGGLQNQPDAVVGWARRIAQGR